MDQPDPDKQRNSAEETEPRIKIMPRNLTARAKAIVTGNPVISRPESAVDVSYPGLEMDQRVLDQRFFPGLCFEFQRDDGAVLTGLEPRTDQQIGLNNDDLSKETPLFLLGLFGRCKVTDPAPQFFSFMGKQGVEVWRRVRDLLPERVTIIVGPSWLPALLRDNHFGERINELVTAHKSKEPSFTVNRDEKGGIAYAILSDERARFIDPDGVIDIATFPPGELTKTLCAPWIYDFRDCICFYWASNKPDIADGTNPPFLNFLRDRTKDPEKPTADYDVWIAQRMRVGRLISDGWKELPIVINDREQPVTRPARTPVPLSTIIEPAFKETEEIVNELRYLATVEHALVVEYLFAHYSLNAPGQLSDDEKAKDSDVKKIYLAGEDLLKVARDEMHHFLWVNQVLRLLKSPEPVTKRAQVIGLPPDEDKDFHRTRIPGFKYLKRPFALRSLTPQVLDEFIEIEKNSRNYGPSGTSFGMYIQILASVADLKSRIDRAQEVIETVKLLIDEGELHAALFTSMRERLSGINNWYRNLKSCDQPGNREQENLRALADVYYRNVLELIHASYALGEKAGGQLIAQAIQLMRSMHEIGHHLADEGYGLCFKLPENIGPIDPYSALQSGEQNIQQKLSAVSETGSPQTKSMAERHLASSRRLYQNMRRTVAQDRER